MLLKKKSAIIPFRQTPNGIEVLLIKAQAKKKWIIPKGTVSKPMKPHVSATKEALEEAGVLGRTYPIEVGRYYANEQLIPTYLMSVDLEFNHYTEQMVRERKWVNEKDIHGYFNQGDRYKLVMRGIEAIKKKGHFFMVSLESYCKENALELAAITKKKARVYLPLKGRIIEIKRQKDNLEFELKSDYKLDDSNKLSAQMATSLLYQNAGKELGYWALKEKKNKVYLSRIILFQLDMLSSEIFKKIIDQILVTIEDFEFIEANQPANKG